MSETINELYLKYVDSVGASLEDDRYFRYLFEITQAGNNMLKQNQQILHKVVDEAWLTIIEDTLDSINSIIEKPRRFVNRVEEVVPVSLAKKITADSVRHLSMNTQFIASTENNDIQPTRILNVTTEDSFDLYENRFIYHLIMKLVNFIDKRTDVIFWSTGDEIRNTMTMESKIDDAYEQIEYKIELKIKNLQSFAENDADNMDVFMRIDRVRRLTMALRTSSFCELMAGCAKVRSPIQRTNLLMKDPDYRKCYNLWQFLERYDSVGYTIEERNTAMEFDEEYLIQMYINLINNYVVFKSLTEEDPRKLDEAALVAHQKLEPKFVKEIHEEIVDDYNIPDVEIRQVIIEEVTQAQLDAQAEAAREKQLREEADAARQKAEATAEEAFAQSQQYMQMMMEAQDQAILAEQARTEAEQAAQEAMDAKAAAEALAAETKANAEEEVRSTKAQAEEEIRATKENAAQQIRTTQEAAQEQMRMTRESAQNEITAVKDKAERECTQAREAMEKALAESAQAQQAKQEALAQRTQMSEQRDKANAAMAAAQEAQRTAESRFDALQNTYDNDRTQFEAAAAQAVTLTEQLDSALDTNKRNSAVIRRLESELTDANTAREQAIDKMRRSVAARKEAESLRAAAQKDAAGMERTIADLQRERDNAIAAMEEAKLAAQAEKQAAIREMEEKMAELLAQHSAQEDALAKELEKNRRALQRVSRKQEERRWLGRRIRNEKDRTPQDPDGQQS